MRDIEIEEDLAFERRSWVVQRIAWFGIILAIAAAALGFLGSSALSKRTIEAEGIEVEYERLSRNGAPTELMLTVTPPFRGGHEVGVWISGDLLRNVSIEKITPEPVRTVSNADELLFVFALSHPDSPLQVRMDYRPEATGRFHAQLGVSGSHQRGNFRVFVYP